MNSLKLPDDAILIPIDMQQAFDAAPWPPRWNDRVDENGLTLLAAWRAAKRPIIHVRHDSVEEGSTLRPDRPGNAFRPGFEPQVDEPLVTKSVNAAFIGTDLDLRLRRLGAETVVLFGISTDMCVSTSVRVGANIGYRVILVEDACDCFDLADGASGVVPARDVHRAHVATLRAEFASVVTTGEVLAALRGAEAA
ncbi:cysteine hydrolase family protein [Sinorhizobium terangae]|uniref:Isochorismatase family protein n=1 Tax=Sinorhizobium terangae TaxID=110322 RepID=A0A6N7LGZ7_SINTE|nr:cysteine hydrolase family protein [Sinorhizobium terangae]MBB4185423.1 nicotinamidase-related amidase [Sinorhizobium terangae]MQX16866.1 isochorismatase family protein [Sinorhizobium terangae]WFU46501.1 cysteine hydrolase family protein [Sinorhizobium terangae]